MEIIIIGLGSILLLGCIVALASAFSHHSDCEEESVTSGNDCSSCNGKSSTCEQICMMEAATKPIEYFDDEELDKFRGKAAENYSDSEVEEFSQVLYTLPPNEVKDWGRSLTLRGINLPNQLKDEFYLMAENPSTTSPST